MGEASSSVPCGSCALCCRWQDVWLLPGDDASRLDVITARDPTGRLRQRLVRRANGECAHLEAGRCSVYAHRPRVCAEFDCREFYGLPAAERRHRDARATPHDKAINARGRELVERARKEPT